MTDEILDRGFHLKKKITNTEENIKRWRVAGAWCHVSSFDGVTDENFAHIKQTSINNLKIELSELKEDFKNL